MMAQLQEKGFVMYEVGWGDFFTRPMKMAFDVGNPSWEWRGEQVI